MRHLDRAPAAATGVLSFPERQFSIETFIGIPKHFIASTDIHFRLRMLLHCQHW